MGHEIERKFLVNGEEWRRGIVASHVIVQAYLARGAGSVVRVRILDGKGFITVKSLTPGLVRSEFEYEIPPEDAAELLEICEGRRIEKTRHDVQHSGRIWSVDAFEGVLAGFHLAEIELASADEIIIAPPWLGREVTADPDYRNDSLARRTNAP